MSDCPAWFDCAFIGKKPFEVDDNNGGVVVEVVTKNYKDIGR